MEQCTGAICKQQLLCVWHVSSGTHNSLDLVAATDAHYWFLSGLLAAELPAALVGLLALDKLA